MFTTRIRKAGITVAALAALGLGAGAIAGAADGPSSKGSKRGPMPPPHAGQHEALPADTAVKVKAAALEEVPGATVRATAAGGPYGTPYHAHIETSDGTRRVVTVNASFEAVEVVEDPRATGFPPPPPHGGPGPDGPCDDGGPRGEEAPHRRGRAGQRAS